MSNEPAFPVQDCAAFQFSGMTLRDYFAGQALAFCIKDFNLGYDEWAKQAYALADALLIERERGQ